MEMSSVQARLFEQLAAATRDPLPALTRRDVRLPAVPGKSFAVTGARRAGKTSFLWQVLADRLAAGQPRESLVLLGLEDDRLGGVTTADLSWFLEEYFTRYPRLRHQQEVTLCLDEVQLVPEWERFVRRVMDTEKVLVLVSGSSSKLLSREVATSLRGRGLEVRVHPFSFREALRHAGEEPDRPWEELGPGERSTVQYHLRSWLEVGGFPEVQSLAPPERHQVLASYVDLMLLRDVIERYNVSNPHAIRWLQRRLLSQPGGGFTVQSLWEQARDEGIVVGKDSFHDYVAYFEDCFLIRTVAAHGTHALRRVNPRKVYPIDTGLIALQGDPGHGGRLETAVVIELERRGYELTYVLSEAREEIGLLGAGPGRERVLVRVGSQADEGFAAAARAHRASPVVISDDPVRPASVASGLAWQSAASWFLSG